MSEPSWMDPIWDYLVEGTLPSNPKETSKLRARSTRFTVHRGTLYKRGFSTLILKCVRKEDANFILRELHEGICGNHIGAHFPSEPLTSVTSPWTFQQWGLDILGPLPIERGQSKFMIVVVDYFRKWVEAEPLATIIEHKVRNFVQRSIICRFGIPRSLVSDNGKQFDNLKFKDFCIELGIKNYNSSPAYPHSNG